MSDTNFDLMWKINMLGAYSAIRAAIPHFLRQGHGRIVLTSSTSGIFGSFGGSNYGTCKNALVGMMPPLAALFDSLPGSVDVSISALCPMAATRMGGTVMKPPPSTEGLHPDLVAPTVAMLSSDEEGSRANGAVVGVYLRIGWILTDYIPPFSGTQAKAGSDAWN
jgi:NAD(P)-dependent dehydrogenase (short-subunit alcohol dehydrogenase family)